jgi:hypothetical protein
LYASPNIIRVIKSRRMRWVGHIACIGDMRNAHNVLVRRLEGERPSRRPRHKWEHNIGMDFREVEWEVVEWIHLA